MRVTERTVSRVALVALVALLAPAAASYGAPQDRPAQINGEVTGVSGDRIHIAITEQDWLPKAGRPVEIGAEMSGMWVPLKGNFVVVQVNADSVEAQHVGNGEHREPARGMKAIIDTAFPNPPQPRAEYVGDPDTEAMVLSMAEGGSREAQHVAALSFEGRGDHDAALEWWKRASDGATDRFFISYSATGRARILTIRGQYREAIGRIYRSNMEAPDAAVRWFSEAAEVMGAAVTNGVPSPDQPTHAAYLMLLNELGNFLLYALEDEPEAVKYLQIAARADDESAQRTLTRLGYPW